jgi:hypothetical protein
VFFTIKYCNQKVLQSPRNALVISFNKTCLQIRTYFFLSITSGDGSDDDDDDDNNNNNNNNKPCES